MRISDWSSDVCSSDLLGHEAEVAQRAGVDHRLEVGALHRIEFPGGRLVDEIEQPGEAVAQIEAAPAGVADVEHAAHLGVELPDVVRTEEHTSELKSLMRLSYAVF